MKFFDISKTILSLAMADFNRHVSCEFGSASAMYVDPSRCYDLSAGVSHISLVMKDVLINPLCVESLRYDLPINDEMLRLIKTAGRASDSPTKISYYTGHHPEPKFPILQ